LLDEFAATGYQLPNDAFWTEGMVEYAEAAMGCDDPKHAAPLFDQLAPWADQWSTNGAVGIQGPISHYLGGLATVLGHYDEADGFFERAVALSERAAAGFFASRSNLSWGQMLTERNAPGDAEKARNLLNEAHAAAAANGYATVEPRHPSYSRPRLTALRPVRVCLNIPPAMLGTVSPMCRSVTLSRRSGTVWLLGCLDRRIQSLPTRLAPASDERRTGGR
jgi:hypothetical protein